MLESRCLRARRGARRVSLAAVAFAAIGAPSASAKPVVTSVTPNHGPASGFYEVVVRGTGLEDVSRLRFGRWDTDVIARTATAVVVQLPGEWFIPGVTTDVVPITATDGREHPRTGTGDEFTFDGPTRHPLTVSPAVGVSGGGSEVTITAPTGADLSDATTVRMGVARAKIVERSTRSVRVIAPGGPPNGTGHVTIEGADGHVDGLTHGYTEPIFRWGTAAGPPSVTEVDPDEVFRFGGDTFTVKGTNLEGVDNLVFNGRSIGGVAVEHIESEPGGPLWVSYTNESTDLVGFGMHEVLAESPLGTSKPSAAASFTVAQDRPTPVITEVSTAVIPQTDRVVITIRGTNLNDASEAQWDTTPMSDTDVFEQVSDTEVRLTTPGFTTREPTRVKIRTKGAGFSEWSPRFEVGSPTPVAIRPTSGPSAGGNRVVVTAPREVIGALNGMWFGNLWAPQLSKTATTLTVLAPPHATGSEPVRLVASNDPDALGQLNPTTDRYTWTPTPPSTRVRYAVSGTATIPGLVRSPLSLKGTFVTTFDQSGGSTGTLALDPVPARLESPSAATVTGRVAFVASTSVRGTPADGTTQFVLRLRVKILDARWFGAIPIPLGNSCQSRLVSTVTVRAWDFSPETGGQTNTHPFDVSELNGCSLAEGVIDPKAAGPATLRLQLKKVG